MGRIFHKLVPETGTEGGWWDLGELYVHITSAMNYVVSVFGLPVPSNRIYILWDESAWEAAATKADPTWEQRSESITSALAALVEANKPEDETMAIIDAIEQFMETQKEFHEKRACQDERVRGRAQEWLKTVGRRAL
ncbi:hypothetical protein N7465_006536 [Penicillium sp. CMV-2018d]|nr:hypothetical protein N7465_006536 [Penicillium sp. CMV-2018d]